MIFLIQHISLSSRFRKRINILSIIFVHVFTQLKISMNKKLFSTLTLVLLTEILLRIFKKKNFNSIPSQLTV